TRWKPECRKTFRDGERPSQRDYLCATLGRLALPLLKRRGSGPWTQGRKVRPQPRVSTSELGQDSEMGAGSCSSAHEQDAPECVNNKSIYLREISYEARNHRCNDCHAAADSYSTKPIAAESAPAPKLERM